MVMRGLTREFSFPVSYFDVECASGGKRLQKETCLRWI